MVKFQLVKRKDEIPDDDLIWLTKNGFRPSPSTRSDGKTTIVWSRMMRAKEIGSASSRGPTVEVKIEQDDNFVWTAKAFISGAWFKGEDPSPERAFEEMQYNLSIGIFA